MATYVFKLIIPANTSELNPVYASADIITGTIKRVIMHYPSGCIGLAHTYLMLENNKILPVNESPYNNIALDDATINIQVEYYNPKDRAELRLFGWNEDTEPHTITCIVEVI